MSLRSDDAISGRAELRNSIVKILFRYFLAFIRVVPHVFSYLRVPENSPDDDTETPIALPRLQELPREKKTFTARYIQAYLTLNAFTQSKMNLFMNSCGQPETRRNLDKGTCGGEWLQHKKECALLFGIPLISPRFFSCLPLSPLRSFFICLENVVGKSVRRRPLE